MNTFTYIIYLVLTYLITVHVGLRFYNNGKLYILNLMRGDRAITASISKLLLTGYYLLNLGYAALMLRTWPTVNSWTEAFSSIGMKTGNIMITLAIIHYLNMGVIFWISKHRTQLFHHKN